MFTLRYGRVIMLFLQCCAPGRARGKIGVVILRFAWAVTGIGQLPAPGRGDGNAVFVVVDFLGDADLHHLVL